MEYHPVHPGDETVVKLDVHCEELGLFPYELRLRATPAPEEKATQIVAMLGGSTTFSLTVNNPARKSAVFAIEVSTSRKRDVQLLRLVRESPKQKCLKFERVRGFFSRRIRASRKLAKFTFETSSSRHDRRRRR